MLEDDKGLWGYVGRFTVVRVIVHTLIATGFLIVQDALPASTRVALETFRPYRRIGLLATSGQIVRAAVMALVLYPFYDKLVRGKRGLLIFSGALWGTALLGSVEPMPGSIEGLIYTETPLVGHLVVLAVGALEVLVSYWLFLRWETWSSGERRRVQGDPAHHEGRLGGYLIRFILLHVITYAVVGGIFFELQSYEEAFAVQEQFELYRPLDDPVVAAAIPIQIVRGGLLALLFYPLYGAVIKKGHGWLLLFGWMFGLTALGAPNFFAGFCEGLVNGKPVAQLLVGPIEIVVQMLLFSGLLFLWERRVFRRGRTRVNDE